MYGGTTEDRSVGEGEKCGRNLGTRQLQRPAATVKHLKREWTECRQCIALIG